MEQKYAVGDKVMFTKTKGGYTNIKNTGIVTGILGNNLVVCEVTYPYGLKCNRSFFPYEIVGKID